MDAQILIADDQSAWAPQSAPTLWTQLRIATLHAIWHCRSWRDDGDCPAARVVRSLTSAIRRDWARVTLDLRQTAAASASLPVLAPRDRDPSLSLACFKSSWCHRNVLCSVQDDPPAMTLLLSHLLPIPIPVAPP